MAHPWFQPGTLRACPTLAFLVLVPRLADWRSEECSFHGGVKSQIALDRVPFVQDTPPPARAARQLACNSPEHQAQEGSVKRLSVLLFFVLALTSVASADQILFGSGTLYAGTATSTPYYTFNFLVCCNAAGLYPVTAGPDQLDDLTLSPGLQHCTPCDPRHNGTLLYDVGITQHGSQVLEGRISFESINYTWALLPGGVLQVKYVALPFISLAWCSDFNCNPPTRTFQFPQNKPWDVTAYFKPDASGNWDFTYAKFTGQAIPEPSSIFLFGSGLGLMARRFRKFRAGR